MPEETCYWVMCFVPPHADLPPKIFGFSEFIAVLALLVIVFTTSDVRYRFRVRVAPLNLQITTFFCTLAIGAVTLTTDLWRVQKWWVPKADGLSFSTWEAVFGLLFLALILTWMYYAFIRPPVYGQRNALRFARTLYGHVIGGSDEELASSETSLGALQNS